MYRCNGRHVYIVLAACAVGTFFVTGCEPGLREDDEPWVGPLERKQNISEAVAALTLHREKVKAVRAGGNCRIEWYEGDGKPQEEKPTIQLRLYPPDRLYFRGDILIGEAIRLGTNAEDFWFRIKPKEVSSYWWGKRTAARKCGTGSFLSPVTLLDALGMVDVDTSWSFVSFGGYDILTLHAYNGRPVKRVHVDWRGYLVKKIEYFDADGLVIVVVHPSNYTSGDDGVVVPARIGILHLGTGEGGVSIDITLKNIKPFEPTQAQLEGNLFAKPSTKGFKNVYMLTDDCDFVRQEP